MSKLPTKIVRLIKVDKGFYIYLRYRECFDTDWKIIPIRTIEHLEQAVDFVVAVAKHENAGWSYPLPLQDEIIAHLTEVMSRRIM